MPKAVVTIGTFDGLHRGHQKIFRKLLQEARRRQAKPVVLTFQEPPRAFFYPQEPVELLMTCPEKIERLKHAGFSKIRILRFNKTFARQSPETFFRKVFLKKHRACAIVVGKRFGFGKDRSGTVQTLKALGRRYGVEILVVPMAYQGGRRISSSEIRRKLKAAQVQQAQALLGYPYFLRGRVVSGSHRGQRLGFPTANVRVPGEKLLPPGVFGVRAHWGKQKRVYGLCNIGTRPTFGPSPITVEVHLLKSHVPPLYGQTVTLEFLKFLRPEKKFSSSEALAAQIRRDVRHFRSLTSR